MQPCQLSMSSSPCLSRSSTYLIVIIIIAVAIIVLAVAALVITIVIFIFIFALVVLIAAETIGRAGIAFVVLPRICRARRTGPNAV